MNPLSETLSMPEICIPADEFYSFVKDKRSHLCSVRSCRLHKADGKSMCHKHRMRLWRARNPMHNAFNNIRNKAKQRKIKFTLSFDQFAEMCELSGYIQGKGQTPDSLSLDRIDPNKGYEEGNIRVISLSENSSKGSYERWVTLKDGTRVRLYQIGITTDTDGYAEQEEAQPHDDAEELPSWLMGHIEVSDNEPF